MRACGQQAVRKREQAVSQEVSVSVKLTTQVWLMCRLLFSGWIATSLLSARDCPVKGAEMKLRSGQARVSGP